MCIGNFEVTVTVSSFCYAYFKNREFYTWLCQEERTRKNRYVKRKNILILFGGWRYFCLFGVGFWWIGLFVFW